MSRVVFRLLAILAALAGAGALVWYFTLPDPVPVVLRAVDRGQVESTVANTRAGTVMARKRARLAPAIGGLITSLEVREGDRVREGQKLLALWNADRAADLELARSEAVAARARAEQACLLAERAEREAARLLELQKKGLASDDVADQAVAEARSKQAACRAAEAAVEVSRAQVDVAEAALARTVLTAPFDGVIAEVSAELGEYVTPSPPGIPTPPAIDLIDDGFLYVSAPIDEVDAPRVKEGLPARIALDAFAGREFQGRVRRVAPYVLDTEKQARTVEVEVEWIDAEERCGLLAGYSADVEVVLESRDDVLRVPTEAVVEGYRVLVYDEAVGRLAARAFEPGIANWEYTQVHSGLREGEQVVVSVSREGVAAGVRAVPESPLSGSR